MPYKPEKFLVRNKSTEFFDFMLTSSRTEPMKLRKKKLPWLTYAGVIAAALPVGLLLSIAVHSFWVFPLTVETVSMSPDYPKGKKIFFSRHFDPISLKKGAAVLCSHPVNPELKVFLRIAATGGDKVRFTDGIFYLNDTPVPGISSIIPGQPVIPADISYDHNTPEILLKDDELYLLADNLKEGVDSRHFGPASKKLVIAVTD
jgi:signal peptidase I